MSPGTNLVLRPPRVEDAPALAAEANDPAVWAGLRDYFPQPYTVDDALRFIEVVLERAGPQLHWFLEVDGQAAGVMSVFPGEDVYRYNAELGYWLGQRHWGRGIMTEAIRQTVAYCWRELTVTRLYAEVFSTNIGSRRVLEKCGFAEEFTLPNVVVKLGERCDMTSLGLRR